MSRNFTPVHTDEAPVTIAREWFDRGRRESDAVFAFISYWITFNQLYNYGRADEGTDRDRIRDFIRQHADAFITCLDFDADYLDVFMESPVMAGSVRAPELDWSYGSVGMLTDKLYDAVGSESYIHKKCGDIVRNHIKLIDDDIDPLKRIMILFDYIYQVRCNLFHGHKTPSPERNWRLIDSSAQVLEVCLPELMKEVFSHR